MSPDALAALRRPLQGQLRAFCVRDFTSIVPKVKPAQIAVQVMLADIVINTIDAALEDSEQPSTAFVDDGIAFDPHVLTRVMVHFVVLVFFASELQRSGVIGHDVGAMSNDVFQNRPKILGRDALDVQGLNLAPALSLILFPTSAGSARLLEANSWSVFHRQLFQTFRDGELANHQRVVRDLLVDGLDGGLGHGGNLPRYNAIGGWRKLKGRASQPESAMALAR